MEPLLAKGELCSARASEKKFIWAARDGWPLPSPLNRLRDALASPPALVLVATNIVPLVGVFALGWSLGEVMLLYWVESAIIGFFTLVKMIMTLQLKVLGLAPFFCIHFGIFMGGHLFFLLFLFFNPGLPWSPVGQTLDVASILGTISIGAGFLLVSHGYSFFHYYVRGKEYRTAVVEQLMLAPYGRIILMHVSIILGAFLTLLLRLPEAALALLVALKTAVDLRAHHRSHPSRPPPPESH